MFIVKLYGSYTHRTGPVVFVPVAHDTLKKKTETLRLVCERVHFDMDDAAPWVNNNARIWASPMHLKISSASMSVHSNGVLVPFFTRKKRNPRRASVDSAAIYARGGRRPAIENEAELMQRNGG